MGTCATDSRTTGGYTMKVFLSIHEVKDPTSFKWIDTRFYLSEPTKGWEAYQKSHIKDALFFDVEKDLSDLTSQAGRHPMPTKEQLTALFRRKGLQLDDKILLVDQGGSGAAARAYWILLYSGFQQVYIVREGIDLLAQEGFVEMTDEPTIVTPSDMTPNWQESYYTPVEEVERITKDHSRVLLDARSKARYLGQVEPIDPVKGRIPTALNFDHEQMVDAKTGQYAPTTQLKEIMEEVIPFDQPITAYCGSGVSAAPVFAMLRHFGVTDVALFVGSFSEWITDKNRPVAIGEPAADE